jgi:hypothetical protein
LFEGAVGASIPGQPAGTLISSTTVRARLPDHLPSSLNVAGQRTVIPVVGNDGAYAAI